MRVCGACDYFHSSKPDDSGEPYIGECRRYAPRPARMSVDDYDSGVEFEFRWHEVSATDWCGEFSAKVSS
jgi:hypothetical protein